jgi:predicted transcriptional regulator
MADESHEDLPQPIGDVNSSLSKVGQPAVSEKPVQVPAVNPMQSVFPDYIICLEDGKRYKSMKRHLRVHYGLTPEQYRERWGLPPEYPMMAPNSAAQRSALAKANGLSRQLGIKTATSASKKRSAG